MHCPKCQFQNEENAQFCRNCGTNLHAPQVQQNQGNDNSSTLLLVYILVAFFVVIVQFVIQRTFSMSYWETPWKYVRGIIGLISGFSIILPALAIKNRQLKIIGIILAALLALYHAYANIAFTFLSY
jgi:hypothetical protein